MKNILILIKKELKIYFNNPAFWLVLAVFLVLWEFLFFRNVFLVGEASLRLLFGLLPWIFLVFVPSLTMGTIANEKKEGTIELLLSGPIKGQELVVAKFLASLIFLAISLLFSLPIALGLSFFGRLDWGIIGAQYLSGLLLGAVLASLGVFASALFEVQVASFLLAAGIGFFLTIIGSDLVTAILPATMTPFLARFSLISHFASMSRGVIDLRDFWYFFSLIFLFLVFAWQQLLKRRGMSITLLAIILFSLNIFGDRIPGRVDLTQDRLYTLSPATRQIVANLNKDIKITFFASSQLPAQLQPVLADIKDLVRDYQVQSKGKITLVSKDPTSDEKLAQEASSLGVREMQFNVIGKEEFQLKTGWLGLSLSVDDKNEVIPFISQVDDLEYQLTSLIKKLTVSEKKKIVFLGGQANSYQVLKNELEKQFLVEDFDLKEEKAVWPEKVAVLVLAGPTLKFEDKELQKIKEFLNQGVNGLFLLDTIEVNPQFLTVSPSQQNLNNLLTDFGLEVNSDLVYDLYSNEKIQMNRGFVNVFLPYPFWVRALDTDKSLFLPWPSSLKVEEKKIEEKGFKLARLFSTSDAAGLQDKNFNISPDQSWPKDNLEKRLLVAALNGEKNRLIVVGDSDFLTDQFVNSVPENLAFGLEAFSWLGQESSLSEISLKQRQNRKLIWTSESQIRLVKYGNLALAVLLPVIGGSLYLFRRRRLSRLEYKINKN